ncbi:ATP-binding protein [Haliovirga abyssi]|uniref:histidine kinase n=1 Tax=Haliovirga abyssi TaxID=2996794 RepID=A0AAU9D2Y5_9FUSO|nr:ATP-binding protein [Haliovirga abyssi]BDU50336.1 sensor histidine kinase [Haliovirga abyssi]
MKKKLQLDSLLFRLLSSVNLIIVIMAVSIIMLFLQTVFYQQEKNLQKETDNLTNGVKIAYKTIENNLEKNVMLASQAQETLRLLRDGTVLKNTFPHYNKEKGTYSYTYKNIKEGNSKIYLIRMLSFLKNELYQTHSKEDLNTILSFVNTNGDVEAEIRNSYLGIDYSLKDNKTFLKSFLLKSREKYSNKRMNLTGIDYIKSQNRFVMRSGALIGINYYHSDILGLVISNVINYDFLEDIRNRVASKNNFKLFILKDNKYLFGDFNLKKGYAILSQDEVKEHKKNPQQNLLENKIIEKNKYEIGYTPLFNISGDTIGFIGVAVSKESIIDSKMRILNYIIGLGIIFIIVTSLILGAYIYKMINPLIEMADISQKIAKGDFSKRINIRNLKGEIKILGKSYNTMVEHLNIAILKLEEQNKKILDTVKKLKVIEKTSSLIHIEKDFFKALYYLTTTLTSEIGLSYSRAIYLEYNENKNEFVGKFSSLSLKLINEEYNKKIDDVDELISQVKKMPKITNDMLDEIAKFIKIPFNENNLITQAIKSKEIVYFNDKAEAHNLGSDFINTLGIERFALVPIAYENNIYGIIIVDNFSNDRLIEKDDIDILKIFINTISIYLEKQKLEKMSLKNERVYAIGKLASSIVHEIRTPLVGIKGFADIILKKYKGDTKIEYYMNIIKSEVTRLDELSTMLLDYSKNKKYIFTKNNLKVVLEESILNFKKVIKSNNIKLELDISKDIIFNFDRNRLKQVFLNLIKNSIEAIAGNDGIIKIKTKKLGKIVEVTFEDNGVGIPAEKLERIFEPFVTNKVQGTGLGLAIVSDIVQSHNGKITIESEEGKGTKFILIFEIYEGGNNNNG